MSDLVSQFRLIGVRANEARTEGDNVIALLTPTQYEKLQQLLGEESVMLMGIEDGRVVARVDESALHEAIVENKKASRRSAVDVTITSSTVYSFEYDSPARNKVVHAEWSGNSGYIAIERTNGERVILDIIQGTAGDFFDDTEVPERRAYAVQFMCLDEITGEERPDMVMSLGNLSLSKRVIQFPDEIIGAVPPTE